MMNTFFIIIGSTMHPYNDDYKPLELLKIENAAFLHATSHLFALTIYLPK